MGSFVRGPAGAPVEIPAHVGHHDLVPMSRKPVGVDDGRERSGHHPTLPRGWRPSRGRRRHTDGVNVETAQVLFAVLALLANAGVVAVLVTLLTKRRWRRARRFLVSVRPLALFLA